MRRLLILVALTTAAVGLAATASAAPPADVHIQLHPTTFCCPQAGTWDASGAISDHGPYVRTDVHGTGSIPDCPTPVEHRGTFQEEFLLVGTQGTLTLDDETVIGPMEEPVCFGEITNLVWQIDAGSGAYDRTNAHGTGFFGPPATLFLDGIAQVG
jgi:hypothetical protein